MASETEAWPQTIFPMDPWPPDDTEESVVGTDLHQMTIINLRWGINEVARLRRTPAKPTPWQALSQTIIMGFARPDDTRYRTLPDVFVYQRPIDQQRRSLSLTVDGPPALVIEVLSDSTYDSDLDPQRGKGYSYAQAGVREYLALDPTGAFLATGGQGWRLEEGVYRPWEPDGEGRWQSREITVAFGLEGVLATVYTPEGKRLLHEGEVEAELERRDETIARQNAQIEELRRRLRDIGQLQE